MDERNQLIAEALGDQAAKSAIESEVFQVLLKRILDQDHLDREEFKELQVPPSLLSLLVPPGIRRAMTWLVNTGLMTPEGLTVLCVEVAGCIALGELSSKDVEELEEVDGVVRVSPLLRSILGKDPEKTPVLSKDCFIVVPKKEEAL